MIALSSGNMWHLFCPVHRRNIFIEFKWPKLLLSTFLTDVDSIYIYMNWFYLKLIWVSLFTVPYSELIHQLTKEMTDTWWLKDLDLCPQWWGNLFDLAFLSRTIAEVTRRGLGGGADKQLLSLNTPPPPPPSAFCLSDREKAMNDRIGLMFFVHLIIQQFNA